MNRVRSAAIPKSAFFALLPALFFLLALLGLSSVPVHAQSASTFYKQGQAAEQGEDYDAAFNAYQQAAAKAPKDLRYREALYRVRLSASGLHLTNGRKLILAGDMQGAMKEFVRANEIDPGNEAALQEIARMHALEGQPAQPSAETPQSAAKQEELEGMGSPVTLRPVSNEPLTLHMAEDAKTVYQAVGRAAGINVLFDPDFNSKRIQVDLTNVSLLDALRIVGTMSNTFWRPVTANTIFVAQNTRAKRTELDEQAVQTFYLTNAWQQNDLNDVQTALRNVLTNIKVYGVASQNALVVRGTPDELLLAQKLINDLDKARPEVVVDIAVMEVSKNWERNLGITWPSSASVAIVGVTNNNSGSGTGTGSGSGSGSGSNGANLTLNNFAHLNANNVAVTVGAATANLLLTDNNTKILQNPRLRATDAQKATMKIGERIPIATGSYQTGAATALVSSLVNTQFQYLDVGVNIEITPTVHYDRDITLKMKIEVTAQSGSVTISGVTEPIIAQKSTEEVVRLREGEANILSGILNQQEQVSWSGIPGLSSIPILKYLFGSKDHTKTDDEVVFMMVPHIVRSQDLSPLNLRTIDTGVGQAIELRKIAVEGRGANAPVQFNPVTTNSTVGTVPGSSATGAAAAAIDQMKQSTQARAQTFPVPQTNLGLPEQTAPAAETPPPPPPPPVTAPPTQPTAAPANGPKVNFLMNPPGAVKAGSTFEVPVVISGATDIDSIPLQIQYDASKLNLVNVVGGDFLSRDQQAVALVHRDDGPGNITINASRPPGAPGVNGAGVVCVLSFEAKAAGDSKVEITRPGALNSKQQPVLAQGTSISVSVK